MNAPLPSPPRLAQIFCLLLGCCLLAGQVRLPGDRLPDLDGGVVADDHDISIEAGVLAQGCRHRDPALLVRNLVGCPGEQHAQVGPRPGVRAGGLAQTLGMGRELRRRPDHDRTVLALGQDDTCSKPLTELGRENEAALVVEAR